MTNEQALELKEGDLVMFVGGGRDHILRDNGFTIGKIYTIGGNYYTTNRNRYNYDMKSNYTNLVPVIKDDLQRPNAWRAELFIKITNERAAKILYVK